MRSTSRRLLRSMGRVIGAVVSLYTASVFAHGSLVTATPKAGAVLAGSPSEVRLQFSEALEPQFSSIKLLDAKGASIVQAKAVVAPTDRNSFVLPLRDLAPGVYAVQWVAATRDGHRTKGSFNFTVR